MISLTWLLRPLPWRSISPSTARTLDDLGKVARVRVTHPFHPLFDQRLEFVKRGRNWQADRVYEFDSNGLLLSLPVEWTDVAEDQFLVVAAGRSPSHTTGLLEMAELVARMRARRSPDGTSGVNRVTP